jgi:ABC-type multidrug transport system ATPase subunit
MNSGLLDATTYFKTYEEREEAFRKRVFSLIPRRHSGPRLFWKDFRRISFEHLSKLIDQPIAYITSDPRDCLAFGTPWQVLAAAHLCASKAGRNAISSIEQIADDFGVRETLFQPIRTLSGGETVKLALAKAYLYSVFSQQLTIASPFSWLSQDNRVYFDNLYRHYCRIGTPVELLALNGEDSTEPYQKFRIPSESLCPPIEFSISLKNVIIPLGFSLSPLQQQETFAAVNDVERNLRSPCLIVGKNGQGKSLIAKALCGAIPSRGIKKIATPAHARQARLLFQDVITQTLLRSFDGLAASASGMVYEAPLNLYAKILDEYRYNLDLIGSPDTETNLSTEDEFRSLLEVKALLIAVRLCGLPSALILDEPDWGLSRDSAIALVIAILKIAGEAGVPVLIISHKPWWHNLANSEIQVQRTVKAIDKGGTYSFQITLACTV